MSRRTLAFTMTVLFAASATAQTLPLVDQTQGASGQGLGAALGELGDVDGDGIADFLAGSPDDDAAGTNAGSVTVYSGADLSIIRMHLGGAAQDRFGAAVSGGGDADGDGVPDYIVGAIGFSGAAPGGGLIQVFSGASGAVLLNLPGTFAGEGIGDAVDWVGDLDGDGLDDFIFGNARRIGGGGNQPFGSAALVSGADGSLIFSHLEANGRCLGERVHGLGDVDGDGVPDYGYTAVTMAQTFFVPISRYFRVVSGATFATIRTHHDPYTSLFGSGFADSSDAGRDLDGDGVPDLLFSLFTTRHVSGTVAARAVSGADGSLIFESAYLMQGFAGRRIAFAGDMNGDGVEDVAFCDFNFGGTYILRGVDGSLLETISATGPTFGESLLSAGDTNGDGLAEVLIGEPGASSAAGRLSRWSIGGARNYGVSPNPLQTLDHGWSPGPTASPSTGTFFVTGATPGHFGFYVVALSPGNTTSSGVEVLIDDTPGEHFFQLFNFDATGSFLVPGDLRNPALASINFYTQIFEVSPNVPQFILASQGLEQRYAR